jgi:cell division protein FtsB
VTRARLAVWIGVVVLAAFALLAGEYGTFDWLTLRRQVAEERAAIQELEVEVDSLDRLARALESDPAAQERAAREGFGMIRDGEVLYRIVAPQPDSR